MITEVSVISRLLLISVLSIVGKWSNSKDKKTSN